MAWSTRPEASSGVVSIIALVLSSASSALTTYLVVALPTTELSTYGISLAAAIVDLVGLGSLTLFILSRRSAAISRSQWLRTVTLVAIGALETLGLSLTLAMLGYTLTQDKQNSQVQVQSKLRGAIIGNLVLALFAAMVQGLYLALERTSKRPSSDHETLHSRMQSNVEQFSQSSQQNTREPTPPMALQSFAPPLARPPVASSPTESRSSSPRSSLRHSLHQIIRPVTSKTRLLKRTSLRDSKSVYSIPYSVETSPSDGFDMWDTSTVDQQDKETILQSQGKGLETIPGSRPVSPAHALDGPFPHDESKESSPKAETTEASLPPSPTSEQRQNRNFTPRPPSTRSQTIRESRSSTPDESHIHPLFRSDSPSPPSATPGTVIIASPQGGHTLTGEQVRARSSSRPTSRLAHSQSFDSSSGTPPIPGLVLAEGAFAGSEPRGRASTISTVRSRAVSIKSDRTVKWTESLLGESREGSVLVEE